MTVSTSETTLATTPATKLDAIKNAASQTEDHRTLTQIIVSQFLEHRLAVGGLIIIFLFITVALMAPLIALWTGQDPEAQNVFNRYHPPLSRIEMSADNRVSAIEAWAHESPEGVKEFANLLIEKQLAPQGAEPLDTVLNWVEATPAESIRPVVKAMKQPFRGEILPIVNSFSRFHLLGTDELGRDVFIRLIYGTRVSIGVGLLVSFAAALVGLMVGSIAGFYGGFLDSLLMRVTDSLLSLPMMPVMIIFAAVDLSKAPIFNLFISEKNQSILKLIVIVCLFSWMTVARLVRGSILSLKEREFVLAAKTLGARDITIILTHLAPNVIAPLLVNVTVNVGQAIIYEASLSFLGLGIQPPTPSWGNMLSNSQEFIVQAPWLALGPALLIFSTVISFNFIGDGLQSAMDPKALRR